MNSETHEFYIAGAYSVAGLVLLGIFLYSWIQVKFVRQKYKRLSLK